MNFLNKIKNLFKKKKDKKYSFREYEKIHRLGKEETDGILDGFCHISEKIDGANTSIWIGKNGEMRMGSRTQDITGGNFNGFCEYVRNHKGICNALKENPSYRLYGEWLVRHTVAYKETSYKKFYLFDIHIRENGSHFLDQEKVKEFADRYGIETVPFIGIYKNPSEDELKELIGKSALGDKGEGIVIKNMEFKNKFGDLCYAKMVTESFKEDNAVVFGGNNKHSDTYWEMWIVNKYITLSRVQKIMNKIEPELNEKFDMKHIPRIMGTVYHDMIQEEAWEIANKVKKIDFDALKRVANKKIKQVYVDIITESVSVADRDNK